MASRFGAAIYLAPYRNGPGTSAAGFASPAGASSTSARRAAASRCTCSRKDTTSSRSTLARYGRGLPAPRGPRRPGDALEDVDASLGVFDTVVMYGNNLGLLASRTKAPRILRRLCADHVGARADHRGGHGSVFHRRPGHLAYHARNRQRGRMGGQIRIRIRFHELATPGSTSSSRIASSRRSWTEPAGGSRA